MQIDKYFIFENGQVQNLRTGRFLKWQDNGNGYKKVTLTIKGKQIQRYIHRLVAEAYCDKKDCHTQVNHIDGNKSNNHYQNLEWCTNSENQIHAHETGLKLNGNKLWNGKFSKEDVNRMKYLDNHISRVEIAKRMGCSKSTVSEILNGNRYKHI